MSVYDDTNVCAGVTSTTGNTHFFSIFLVLVIS